MWWFPTVSYTLRKTRGGRTLHSSTRNASWDRRICLEARALNLLGAGKICVLAASSQNKSFSPLWHLPSPGSMSAWMALDRETINLMDRSRASQVPNYQGLVLRRCRPWRKINWFCDSNLVVATSQGSPAQALRVIAKSTSVPMATS